MDLTDLDLCPNAEALFADAMELRRIYVEEVTVKSVIGSFSGLKEYEPGDPIHRISWTSSLEWDGLTTHGLVVKEYEDTARKDLLIIMDYAEAMRYGYGLELMMERAAKAAVYFATVGSVMSSFLRLLALGEPLLERELYEPQERQAFTAALNTFCRPKDQVDRFPRVRADVILLITSVWIPLKRARRLISSLRPRGSRLMVVAVDMERIAPPSDVPVSGATVSEEDLMRWERHRELFGVIARGITPHYIRYVSYRDLHKAVKMLGELLAWVEPL